MQMGFESTRSTLDISYNGNPQNDCAGLEPHILLMSGVGWRSLTEQAALSSHTQLPMVLLPWSIVNKRSQYCESPIDVLGSLPHP